MSTVINTIYNKIDAANENTNVPEIHVEFQDSNGEKIYSNDIRIEHINKIEGSDNTSEFITTNGEVVIAASNTASYDGKIRVLEGVDLKKGIIEFQYKFEAQNNQPQNVVISGIKNTNSSNISIHYIAESNKAYFYIKAETEITDPQAKIVDGNTIRVDNISEIGDAIEIIASNDADSKSITPSQMISYLQENGISVSKIENIHGQNVELNGEELLGTGATIITNNGDYQVIVYGDTTGDGEIDAADISEVIDNFLGNNTSLSKISQIAGDVYKDDELNAGDISSMINSFLGNLDGDILQENNN